MLTPLDEAGLAVDIALAGRSGPDGIARRQRERLAALVAHARARSPFYRDLYRGLDEDCADLGRLPPVTKSELMADFDRWVTSPGLDLASVKAFLADRQRIGDLHDGRVAVWRSSGSSGETGVFLHDRTALRIYDLLFAIRAWQARAFASWPGLLAQGGRMACVTAGEDHFAGIASWRRLARSHPYLGPLMRDFSVLAPMEDLVARLNAWKPAQIVGYPSALALLAREREAGRLNIAPSMLFAGGECLDGPDHDAIERAFGCELRDTYACAECDYVAFGCAEHNLHVNADWIIVEPVDERGEAVVPGVASRTVLVTNLANLVQPIIRYDLGDSVTVLPGPCACGSALPAIRVEGRRAQLLLFRKPDGRQVTVLPTAITTAVELVDEGVRRFRVVREAASRLCVECEFDDGIDSAAAGSRIADAVRAFLARQGLAEVHVEVRPRPLPVDPVSGKFQQVVSLLESD